MGDFSLAYAIDPAEGGWRWRVFDIEGELVARGVETSQAEAETAAASAARQPQPFRRSAQEA